VAVIEPPADLAVEKWPLLNDIGEDFYVKPDVGRLLLSPADETPTPPCDVRPEDLDLALAVDRLETATTLKVRRLLQPMGRAAELRTPTARLSSASIRRRRASFGWRGKAATEFRPRLRWDNSRRRLPAAQRSRLTLSEKESGCPIFLRRAFR
jgi:hypothetical protein